MSRKMRYLPGPRGGRGEEREAGERGAEWRRRQPPGFALGPLGSEVQRGVLGGHDPQRGVSGGSAAV